MQLTDIHTVYSDHLQFLGKKANAPSLWQEDAKKASRYSAIEFTNADDVLQRQFGRETMVSGFMSLEKMQNQESVFGYRLPPATKVAGIDPVGEANKPIFDFVSKPIDYLTQGFDPTRPFDRHGNDCVICPPHKAA